MLDVNNFRDFTLEEYRENLNRLGVDSHTSLVGKKVYYVKTSYGEHKVLKWNSDTAMFLLEYRDGSKFHSNPFQIIQID